MLLNLVVETVVGSIPVAGDLFDIGFRADLRNVALLDPLARTAAQDPEAEPLVSARTRAGSRRRNGRGRRCHLWLLVSLLSIGR